MKLIGITPLLIKKDSSIDVVVLGIFVFNLVLVFNALSEIGKSLDYFYVSRFVIGDILGEKTTYFFA